MDVAGGRREDIKALALAFFVAFSLRFMPELQTPYPVGYDIPTYAVGAAHFLDNPLRILSGPLLMFAILSIFHSLGLELCFALKFITPVLYGLMAVSFYVFLRVSLGWDVKKSLLCTILCILQPTALRISWDLLKMEFGLTALFLFMASFAHCERSNGRALALTSFLSLVVTLSHQLPTVLMFIFLAYKWWKERALGHMKMFFLTLLPFSFFMVHLLVFIGVIKTKPLIQFREVIWLKTLYDEKMVLSVCFPRNYLLERPFRSGGWVDVILYVPLAFVMCFAFLLPLVPFGLRHYGFLDVLSYWLAFATFSVIACPWAYPFAHFFRWLLLMVFPLSIYATEGVFRLAERFGKRILALTIALNTIIAVGYANGLPYSNVSIPPPMTAYMPNRMTYSTIELYQIDDCKVCILWLNEHVENNSVLVVEQRFFAWALMWLDERIPIAVYKADVPLDDVELGDVLSAYEHVYILWYVGEAPSWENYISSELFSSGDIAVYEFSRGSEL